LRDQEVAVQFRPEVVVTTIGGRTDVRPEKARLLVRNAVRCVRRTQSRRAAVVTLPIVMLWQLRLLLQAAVRRSGRQSMTSRLAGCAAAVGAWREAW